MARCSEADGVALRSSMIVGVGAGWMSCVPLRLHPLAFTFQSEVMEVKSIRVDVNREFGKASGWDQKRSRRPWPEAAILGNDDVEHKRTSSACNRAPCMSCCQLPAANASMSD